MDFTTTLIHLRMDRGCEVFLFTSPAYLHKRVTCRDYIRLGQIYRISQEGFETTVMPSTPLLILLGRTNS